LSHAVFNFLQNYTNFFWKKANQEDKAVSKVGIASFFIGYCDKI
jgi:hypothetical protein